MSESKSNRKSFLLAALIIVVLVGVCFFCVTLYAKKEINKPTFTIPEQPAPPSLTETLTDKTAAFNYAAQKYAHAVEADDTEGSWKTQARLDGDWQTPFSNADEAFLLHIRDNAGEKLSSFYPSVSRVRMTEAQDVPTFAEQARDVLDFTVTLGRENNEGKIVDTDRYYLTLTFDPQSEDTSAMPYSETFRSVADELSSVAVLSDTRIEAEGVKMCFVIDCITEQLLSVEILRDYRISTSFRLTNDAAALLAEREGTLTLPYGTTQKIEFLHYGAHFTERAIAVKPSDIKALPADVSVNENATKADYTLTFTSSEPEVLSFDEDGVMTVNCAFDDPVIVTMTLDYNGHTYTHQMTVYISQWEVASDVGT